MRPYTGFDGIAKGKRPGLEAFANGLEYLTGGMLWNNGTFGVRRARGKSTISNHATARVVDISRRHCAKSRNIPEKPGAPRAALEGFIAFLIANADSIGLELIVDYAATPGAPFGRAWKCSRETWKAASRTQLGGGGASWADWIHVEFDADHADRVDWQDAFWVKLCAQVAPKPKTAPKKNP